MSFAENTAMGTVHQDGYLTVGEFAAKLRVQPQTIYAAIDNGEIEGVIRVGSRRGLRIPCASYDAFVESRRVTAINPTSQFDPVQLAEPTAA